MSVATSWPLGPVRNELLYLLLSKLKENAYGVVSKGSIGLQSRQTTGGRYPAGLPLCRSGRG